MIKVEVINEFTLADFHKLNNLQRKSRAVEGKLFLGDTFECDEKMMKYLTGENKYKKEFVKVIEVMPEVKAEFFKEKKEPELKITNVRKVETDVKQTKKTTKKKKK